MSNFRSGDKIETSCGMSGIVTKYSTKDHCMIQFDTGMRCFWRKNKMKKIEEPKFKVGERAYVELSITRGEDNDGDLQVQLLSRNHVGSLPYYFKPQDLLTKEDLTNEQV